MKIRLMRIDNAIGHTAIGGKIGNPYLAQQTYRIVNPHEADLHNGKISIKSPIGKALLGKKAGDDEVVVKVPAGLLKFRVESVEL